MDYRSQVSTVMTLNFYSSRGLDEYMKDGKPNMEAIYKGVISTASLYQCLDLENLVGIKYKEPVCSPDEIIDSACNLLTIISTLSYSHPYNGKKNYRDNTRDISIVYDKEWLKYLKKINRFLLTQWNSRKLSIIELMKRYEKICIDTKNEIDQKGWIEEKQEGGTIVSQLSTEGSKLLKNNKVDISGRIDYELLVQDFFMRVKYIEDTLMPKMVEVESKLEFYEKKFQIKNHGLTIIITAIFIFIFGIIVPLFLQTWQKTPHIRSIEIILLISTMLPYIIGLFYLLKKVSGLKII